MYYALAVTVQAQPSTLSLLSSVDIVVVFALSLKAQLPLISLPLLSGDVPSNVTEIRKHNRFKGIAVKRRALDTDSVVCSQIPFNILSRLLFFALEAIICFRHDVRSWLATRAACIRGNASLLARSNINHPITRRAE